MGDIVYILGLCPKGLKPSNSLFNGAIRAYGLSIAARLSLLANSGPASDNALIRTLRAALASSTYLLPQIPGLGRSSDDDYLNPHNLFNPPDPLFKGAIRAYGLSIAAMTALPANFGPASDDALLHLWTVLFRLPSPEKVYRC